MKSYISWSMNRMESYVRTPESAPKTNLTRFVPTSVVRALSLDRLLFVDLHILKTSRIHMYL